MECRRADSDRDSAAFFDAGGLVDKIFGDAQAARQIAQSAVRDFESSRQALVEALESQDGQKVHYAVHSIKGVASLVLCGELAEQSAQLDQMAKNDDMPGIRAESSNFLLVLDRAIEEIRSFSVTDEPIG